MEGKGVLFKRFADIDVFDLELDTRDTEEFIRAVKILEPTFGGINLEDIAAPECFEIEERLKKEMKTGIFISFFRRSSISKHSGAAMSSRVSVDTTVGESNLKDIS